ncbi:DUF6894 family protein [Lichenibacterium ramalinae]|uniref:DUF6894 domain-containing protein n=1 Tax=Lichenibacterium ramalinae TaxID=2316527 RepID=A0A4Q2RJ61_9HYPH|nr:hypothetical protein [Lichenibacterium ramalinae]RYB07115.1 hypothetical protein D3272_03310 [Lichenibacterium ramalinae]
MPRFFFDVETAAGSITDTAGIDLPDHPALVREVIDLLQYLVGDMPSDERHGSASVKARSEDGNFRYEGIIKLDTL